MAEMLYLGMRGKLLRWLTNFLSERSFRVRLGSTESDKFTLQNGIVQGSVLSPPLFAIMINELRACLTINNALFADDLAIWDSGKNYQK